MIGFDRTRRISAPVERNATQHIGLRQRLAAQRLRIDGPIDPLQRARRIAAFDGRLRRGKIGKGVRQRRPASE